MPTKIKLLALFTLHSTKLIPSYQTNPKFPFTPHSFHQNHRCSRTISPPMTFRFLKLARITFELSHLRVINTIRVCGNRCHTLSFKDEDNRKSQSMQKRISYKTAISDFSNFENFGNFEIFSTFFFYFFQKIPPNFKIFKKPEHMY